MDYFYKEIYEAIEKRKREIEATLTLSLIRNKGALNKVNLLLCSGVSDEDLKETLGWSRKLYYDRELDLYILSKKYSGDNI